MFMRFMISSTFEYLPLWIEFVTLSGYPDYDRPPIPGSAETRLSTGP